MSKLIPGNCKHLTLEDRLFIEKSLNEHKSFREIARYLCKDPSTISKEVWKHRIVNTFNRGSFNNPYNFCIHRYKCRKTNACDKLIICDTLCRSCHRCNNVCSRFEREHCRQIEKAPYVCNGCSRPRHMCTIQTKYDYNAKAAQRHYGELLVSSRKGVNLTRKEFKQLNETVTPLIAQGQSPYMIITNHPELGISVKTLYNYIDQGILFSRNIHLKRKVRLKPRKKEKNSHNQQGRVCRQDLSRFQGKHCDETDYVQMDTVLSARGSSKCILTLYFPYMGLLIGRLMNRCTEGAVKAEFDKIQKALGGS